MFRTLGRIDKTANRLLGQQFWLLGKIGHTDVTSESHLPVILQSLSCENIEQRRLAISVTSDKGSFLSGVDAKGDVVEKQFFANRLSKILNCKERVRH